jgi:protein-L-isoaspartate(D-aspartate) O-methyltransferase
MNIEQARFNMIEQQIRPWDVLDQGVLSLLAVVKREDFTPAAYRSMAFVDTEVPLPGGQCMLAPKVEARLLQELAVHKHERVLEVGAGSGFMAALLGHQAQHVTTMEILPELAKLAADNLRRASVMNVDVVNANGCKGLVGDAPFDVILLSGSVAEVPPALLAQLKVGGRLAAIVGQLPIMRAMLFTRRSTASTFSTRTPHGSRASTSRRASTSDEADHCPGSCRPVRGCSGARRARRWNHHRGRRHTRAAGRARSLGIRARGHSCRRRPYAAHPDGRDTGAPGRDRRRATRRLHLSSRHAQRAGRRISGAAGVAHGL